MRVAADTERGRTRPDNQDDYRAAAEAEDSLWAVVCDGMGGAAGGALASALAVRTVQAVCAHHPERWRQPQMAKQLALSLVQRSNELVYEQAESSPDLQGMGTTIVLLLVSGDVCTIAYAGDSRAYLVRGGQLRQITKDHSVVQEMVDRGIIAPQDARDHPRKNMITRAVGVLATVEPDLLQFTLEAEDTLLLCTDGLVNAVSEETIGTVLRETPFFECPRVLLENVLQQAEQDNATVVLCAFDKE